MEAKSIYLAIPHSSVDKNESFRLANEIAAKLMLKGYIVFSPISMGHSIALKNSVPTDFTFWEKVCKFFVPACDEFGVVCLEGYKESIGVKAEKALAHKLEKKIRYIDIHGEFLN